MFYQVNIKLHEDMETVEQRIVEQLTPEEKQKLIATISGYGRLSSAARTASLHFQTLKNVALLGRGEKNTIDKIRKTLLAA